MESIECHIWRVSSTEAILYNIKLQSSKVILIKAQVKFVEWQLQAHCFYF